MKKISQTVDETKELSKDTNFVREWKEIIISFNRSLNELNMNPNSKYAIKIFDGSKDTKNVIFTSEKSKKKIIMKKLLENLNK